MLASSPWPSLLVAWFWKLSFIFSMAMNIPLSKVVYYYWQIIKHTSSCFPASSKCSLKHHSKMSLSLQYLMALWHFWHLYNKTQMEMFMSHLSKSETFLWCFALFCWLYLLQEKINITCYKNYCSAKVFADILQPLLMFIYYPSKYEQ